MKRFLLAGLAILYVTAASSLVRADDKDPMAVLDKAIKAVGGEEKLKKIDAFSWTTKADITFNENTNHFTSHATLQGLDHYRSDLEGEFGGNPFKGLTVINGDKGWRKFGENKMDLDAEALANEKRRVYLRCCRPCWFLEGEGLQTRVRR